MARYQGRFERSRRRPAPEKAPQKPVLPAEEAPSAADPAEAVTAQRSETSQEPERAAEKVSAHAAENAPEDGALKKKKRGSRIGVILVCILVVLAAAMGSLALHVYLRGKRMRQNTSAPNLAALQQPAAPAEAPEAPLPEEEAPAPEEPEKALEVVDEGTIRYGGKLYRYNSDITTFLLLGIDSQQPENTDGTCNVDAFSDVIMLAAVDFRNRQISLLTLSRDTMCEFQRLNPDGSERDWATGQLALTFSYGDGALKSCEITKNAVSQALSDLPIQSCSALYLDGLRRLTDAVGGVTVTVLEDLSYGYASMQVGAEVTLDGAMAERYIRARERTEEGNLKRMERQKQFFTALMKKVLASVKERPASILDLYGKISSDVVTDLETGDILYLATEASGMRIDTNIRNVPGTVTSDENGFVQYDLDEAGLLELLLDVYYEAEE